MKKVLFIVVCAGVWVLSSMALERLNLPKPLRCLPMLVGWISALIYMEIFPSKK